MVKIVIIIPFIIFVGILIIVMSSLGMLSVLEEDYETTA